jgi:ketosteroid isomerase-like protein
VCSAFFGTSANVLQQIINKNNAGKKLYLLALYNPKQLVMKVKFSLPALLIGAALVFSACNDQDEKTETASVDMDKLKTEIQAMEDEFAAAEKAKDPDAVMVYYADDAISYNRNEPPSVGKAAIREKIAKGIAGDTAGVYNVYKVVDLFAEGNTATEIGSWTRMNAAGEKMDDGYYMSYFQKRDGKYQCVRDMSVTASPAKPGM